MPSLYSSSSLFEEINRIQTMFSDVAASLAAKFFGKDSDIESSDALQHVLDTTRQILEADKCALFLVDISRRSLILERASGSVQFESLKNVGTYDIDGYDPSLPGTGVTPWVWYTRRPFNAKSFDELIHNSEGHWKGNWDVSMYGGREKAKIDFKCVYMVPLVAGNECLGVLKYENRTGDKLYFDDDDERLINMIGSFVANLVISQRIERNRYDRILPRISRILVASFGDKSFYEQLLEECRQILAADLCSLFLVDSQDNLVLRSIVGKIDKNARQQLSTFYYENYKTSKGLTPWILRVGRAFNVRNFPDLYARSEGNHWGKWDDIIYHGRPEEEFKSLYSTPLIIGDNRIGVLKVENKYIPPYYFTESDEALFDLIGRLIAIGTIYDTEKYFGSMIRAAELGFLAAGISHEFYNYLERFLAIVANANDFCSMTSERCKVKDRVLFKLGDLRKEIKTAERVIDHFRKIRNRQDTFEPFEPDGIINDVLALCKRRFEGARIKVKYKNEISGQLTINPAAFQTILTNLLKNAFESILENSNTYDGIISIKLRPSAPGKFCLTVEDSGKGIDDAEESHMFLPFFTTKTPRGMGFGLFGVQRIVSALTGEIKVTKHNKYGGATFEIEIPNSPNPKRNVR